MSLDKDASSDPNLKAVHAGASMRKAQHLQPKASDIADAEVGYFAFGEKPTLPAKRSFSLPAPAEQPNVAPPLQSPCQNMLVVPGRASVGDRTTCRRDLAPNCYRGVPTYSCCSNAGSL